jgi:predicted ATP-grasp superfamily ATP-dependent carboligase
VPTVNKPIDVLLLDGNSNQAVACVRSLARAGHRVFVGADTSWSKAAWSRYSSEGFRYCSPERDCEAFVSSIVEQTRLRPGALILPLTDRTSVPLSSAREQVTESGGRMVLPPHASLMHALDKWRTRELATSLGIASPRSALVNDEWTAVEVARTFFYPVVLKAHVSLEVHSGGWTRSTPTPLYARTAEEFLAAYQRLAAQASSVVVQEFIEGEGAGYFALMCHGEVRAEFAHRRLRDLHPTGSGSTLRVSAAISPQMRDAGLALLRALNWHGVAMIEFRVRPDGSPVFLEINGRFWQSLALPIHAGVDFPRLLAELAQYGDTTGPTAYTAGVRCRWLFGDLCHLLEVWKGAPVGYPGKFPRRLPQTYAVLRPTRNTHHDNFAWSDPLPELGDWTYGLFHKLYQPSVHRRRTKGAMFRGAIHIHSTYSDGEFTLAELRRKFLQQECRFAIVADHAEAFDEAKLRAYEAELHRLSDAEFIFIPGLEFECERRMHILSLGTLPRRSSVDPEKMILIIQDSGGLAVVAHPADTAFPRIEQFTTLPDGIETWNSKYDGRNAPRPQTFALLQRLQPRRAEMKAFYGQDLHWKTQDRRLLTVVECERLTPCDVISALRQGSYFGGRNGVTLPSDGSVSPAQVASFARRHERSRGFQKFAANAQQVLSRHGITMPAIVKAQFRRFL